MSESNQQNLNNIWVFLILGITSILFVFYFQEHISSEDFYLNYVQMNHERIFSFFLRTLKNELSVILLKEKNIIKSLFYGTNKIQFFCNRCKNYQDQYFQSFEVSQCNFENKSVQDLFRSYSLIKWFCNHCNYCGSTLSNVTVTNYMLPQFLIVQLEQNIRLNTQSIIPMNINTETHGIYYLKFVIKSIKDYKKILGDYLLFILNFSDNRSTKSDNKCNNKKF